MPQYIKHIDKIAREKNRAVVFVTFEPETPKRENYTKPPYHLYLEYDEDINRKEFIKWLDESGIKWEPCDHFASETGFMAYGGNIYLDIPWDENDPHYIKVIEKLENPDGSMKDPRVKFWGLTLEEAMVNAHHDALGFWEEWAKNF